MIQSEEPLVDPEITQPELPPETQPAAQQQQLATQLADQGVEPPSALPPAGEPLARGEEPGAPAAPEPVRVASLGEWLGKMVNRAKAVVAPPSFDAALAAERAARMAKIVGPLLDDTLMVGAKTIKLDYSRLGNPGELDVLINSVAEQYRGVFDKVKRGVITDVELKELAAKTGLDEKAIIDLAGGTTLNAEKMLAANQIMASVGKRVLATRDEIRLAGMENDPEARLALAGQFANLLDVAAKTRGASSEIGRALRVMQIPVEGLAEAKQVAQFMEQVTDPTGVGWVRFQHLLDGMASPQQVGTFAKLLDAAPNALVEAWMNALLSGPATHIANLTGNVLALTNGVLERMVAGGFGTVRRGVGGANNGVYVGESVEMAMAAMGGLGDAWRAAWKTFKTGEQSVLGSKFDGVTGNAISSDTFGASGVLGMGIDGLGTIINLPKRGLAAEDEFFKALSFQMELRAQAYRLAKQQGLSGTELRDEMGRIMQNPSTFKGAFEASQDYARYVTFNRELGPAGKAIQDWANAHWYTKAIAPFTTAPANLTMYGYERFPVLNLVMKSMRADLSGANGGVARDLAMAKFSVGAGAAMLAAHWTFSGVLTGRGPLDPNVRRDLMAQGWKPYSIWDPIGKQYVAYDRTDPLGMFLGTVADLSQVVGMLPERDAKSIGAAIGVAFSGVFMNKTYVQGFAGVVNALENAQRGDVEGPGIAQMLHNYAGSLVPAAVAQFTKANDPVMRDIRTWQDAIYARLPGWSKDVSPKADIYGRPTLREQPLGWAPDIAIPFKTSTPKDEPGLAAIVEHGISIMPLSRTLIGQGEHDIQVDPIKAAKQPGVTLEPKEYDRWNEILKDLTIRGKTLKGKLDSMVEPGGVWDRQSEDMKANLIKNEVLVYRQVAKAQLYKEHPEILDRVKAYYHERGERLKPSRIPEAAPGSSVDSGDISPGVSSLTSR